MTAPISSAPAASTLETARGPYAGKPASAIAADMIRDVRELQVLVLLWAVRLEVARQCGAE